MIEHQPYHTLLEEAFRSRREKNPSYSLRAFSRSLGISPTVLSRVLRYERDLSPKNLRKLATYLELSPAESERLTSKKKKTSVVFRNEKQIADDEFKLISDWYYFGILNLAQTILCKADPHWIAKRLGISAVEANGAVTRLKRMGYLEEKRGRLYRTVAPLLTTTEIPSSALRKLHKQQLRLASQAIDHVPVELRSNHSVTLAIDPSRVKIAKKKIAEFRESLGDLLEASGEKSEVYLFTLHLFPLREWGDPG